jgi:Ca2+-binding EF-hand superfamily protein
MTEMEFRDLMLPQVSQRLTQDLDTVVSAFHYNREQTAWQKLARRIIAENAPEARDMAKIRSAFHKLDRDGNGTLRISELATGIKQAGYMVSEEDLKRVFDELDTDGTGQVHYKEFVAGALRHDVLVEKAVLHWVFDYIDDDDSKTITRQNLEVRHVHACARVPQKLSARHARPKIPPFKSGRTRSRRSNAQDECTLLPAHGAVGIRVLPRHARTTRGAALRAEYPQGAGLE